MSSIKLFGGMIVGASVTGILSYAYHQTAMKKINHRLKEVESVAIKSEDYKKELEEYKAAAVNKYGAFSKIHNHTVMVLNNIANVNMIADIAAIKDVEARDECLTEIDNAISNISRLSNAHKSDNFDSDEINIIIEKMDSTIQTMTDNIKEIINDIEDDDDDDDEDDSDVGTILISPKTLILHDIHGNPKIFNTDPDVGFEVLEGSNPIDNDYCIMAQNVPELYKFLFNSIKEQLSNHYAYKIDSDVFDTLLDDIVITVSFSFIDDSDTDANITAVSAVVPFEIFGESSGNKLNIYSIYEGELNSDNVIRYFTSSNSKSNIQNESKTANDRSISSKNTSCKMEQNENREIHVEKPEIVGSPLSKENLNLFIDEVGFNREALQAFSSKLQILMHNNKEAGNAIYTEYVNLLTEIYVLSSNNNIISDEDKQRICNSLKALYTNMKKNYGSSIKSY